MPSPIKHLYRFGKFTLDEDQKVLLCEGKSVALRPKVLDTLLILLEKNGRIVRKDELMNGLWPDTFVEEANLTFNIQQLRKCLGDDARTPIYIETIARRGYRFIAPVTTEQIQSVRLDVRHADIYSTQTNSTAQIKYTDASLRPGLRVLGMWLVVGTVVALSATALAGWWLRNGFVPGPPTSSGKLMLAVLPFQNLTGDVAQDYFSDALTDEMIAQLGLLNPDDFGVIARTSVMRYKNSQQSLNQIAAELGVQYVLEGSVRRDSDRVRITAQLIQVRYQTHIWTRQYDRQLQGLLILQREIGEDVANQIQLALGNGKVPGPADHNQPLSPTAFEAYDLCLKGRYFWNKRSAEGFQKAIEYFQRASEIEPTYARAYVGLADCYVLLSGYTGQPATEFVPKARAAARRALAIDESLAEAHTTLALIVQNYDWDWQTAEKEFRRAIELNPNYATARHWLAEHLMWRGYFDEACRESEQARRLDPNSLIIAADHGAILYFSRQYDRAIEQFRAVRELEPNFLRASLITSAYEQKGLFADALQDVETHRKIPDSPWYWSEIAYIHGQWGKQEPAKRALRKLHELNQRQEVDAATITWAYLGLGDQEQALAWLERAYSQHSNTLITLKVEPRFDPLRSEARFQDLLRRVGLNR